MCLWGKGRGDGLEGMIRINCAHTVELFKQLLTNIALSCQNLTGISSLVIESTN